MTCALDATSLIFIAAIVMIFSGDTGPSKREIADEVEERLR